jgi:hypothetical protein
MQKFVVRASTLSKPIASANPAARVQPYLAAPTLAEVWRSTLETAITHAAPLLLLGVIGFAAVPLLSAGLAVLSMPLARIAITHIAQHGSLSSLRWRCLPAALLISWVYMAALMAGQIGISVPLRAWGLNLNFADQAIASWDGAAQAMMMRSVNALSNTPDLAFNDQMRRWRNQTFDVWAAQPDTRQETMADYWQRGPDAASGGIASIESQTQTQSRHRPDLRLVFIAGVMLIFLAETLLAFRSVTGVKPAGLLWLSLKNFGTLAGHVWLLRIALVALKAVFVFMPVIVVSRFWYLAHDWNWFGSPTQEMALVICVTVIHAVVSTVEAVYAARLFVRLNSLSAIP